MIIFKPIMFLIRVVAMLAVMIFIFGIAYGSYVEIIEENDIDRAGTIISENMLNSKLTSTRSVFKVDELMKYDGTNDEPYARFCNYGYNVVIEDFLNDKKWSFGYEPGNTEILEERTVGFPVQIMVTDFYRPSEIYNNNVPATMKLAIYDTWLTRISCMAEKSFNNKEIQKMEIDCLEGSFGECYLHVKKNDDDLCLFYLDNAVDCRRLDVPVSEYKFVGSFDKKTLWAFPSTGALNQESCNDIETLKKTKINDDETVANILFCME